MANELNPRQVQLTCVIECLLALNHEQLAARDTDPAVDAELDEVRDGLISAYRKLSGDKPFPELPIKSDEERTAWLEQRCFEQREAGLR